MSVVRSVLNQVINELAIDEVLGSFCPPGSLLSELVSERKAHDPLIQAAYAASDCDVEALMTLAERGNWYAALIGSNLANSCVIPNDKQRAKFRQYCVNPDLSCHDREISTIRNCKKYSILAREILNHLRENPKPNVLAKSS